MSAIPAHLRHRPTWRGLVVPHVNCWGAETDEHGWTLEFDPRVDGMAWFTAEPGPDPEPNLARQNLQRQRQCAADGLCQVCARLLAQGPRWLLVANATAQLGGLGPHDVLADGKLLVSEPWICRRCLPYVLATCPRMSRLAATEDLAVLKVHRWKLLVSHGYHEDHGPDVLGAMWVKIQPTAAEVLEPGEALQALGAPA